MSALLKFLKFASSKPEISEKNNGYIADIPDLKHCSAFGTTQEETLKEALKAKEAWLETA